MDDNGETADWETDPNVQVASQERDADEIALLSCPRCGRYSYWGEGNWFHCRFCDEGFYAWTADEIAEQDKQCDDLTGCVVCCDEVVTVADLIGAAAFEQDYP